MITSRFAPSPTGHLHLGHIYSAVLAAQQADRFLLRIEDIDQGRCRAEFIDSIYDDLSWLGLTWETPVRIQSEHFKSYQNILEDLRQKGLVYPCFCTRKDILKEIEGAVHAPHGPDGALYPGTCKHLDPEQSHKKITQGQPFALRLHMDKAMEQVGPLFWHDLDKGEQVAKPEIFGDIVLGRKDVPTSYHLSVCLDDHLQGVNRIVRGVDLFDATHIHRLLQALLNLDTPEYFHHPLIRGEDGKRLAKRDKALTIKHLRESGISRDQVLERLGIAPG